jgi:hypothetical protein
MTPGSHIHRGIVANTDTTPSGAVQSGDAPYAEAAIARVMTLQALHLRTRSGPNIAVQYRLAPT